MKPTIFLILSLVGCISTGKTPPKIVLSTLELRQIVVDLIRAEVSSNLPNVSTSTVSNEIEEQLSRIKQGLQDNTRKTKELIQNYEETLEQTERQCRNVNTQLRADGATGESSENVTLRQEVLKMSTELEIIKEKLEIIQVSLLSRQESTPKTSASLSVDTSTKTPELYATDSTPKEEQPDLMSTQNPTVTSQKISTDEFEATILSKPLPSQGSSYNGTSADVISAKAASQGYEGRHMTVEFVNYLNRSIKDFQLYDPNASAFHCAPKFIPPNNKEIFTFREPVCWQCVAFSYRIPQTNVRLASMLRLEGAPNGFGMAFVEEESSMENYYDSSTGIRGSSEYFKESPFTNSTREFVLRYDGLQARAALKIRSFMTGSLKIELIEVR